MNPVLPQLLNPHLAVFKKVGLWPFAKRSPRQFLHFSFAFTFPFVGYICIMVTNIFCIESVERKTSLFNLVCSTGTYLIKGLILYYKRSDLDKVLNLIAALEKKVHRESQTELKIIKDAHKLGRFLFLSFSISYASSWISWMSQGIFLGNDSWTSKEAYPNEFVQNEYIFSCLLLFQFFTAAPITLLCMICDTFTITVNIIFGAYIDILAERLCQIGTTQPGMDGVPHVRFDERDYLKECIKMHEVCLRFVILLFVIFAINFF